MADLGLTLLKWIYLFEVVAVGGCKVNIRGRLEITDGSLSMPQESSDLWSVAREKYWDVGVNSWIDQREQNRTSLLIPEVVVVVVSGGGGGVDGGGGGVTIIDLTEIQMLSCRLPLFFGCFWYVGFEVTLKHFLSTFGSRPKFGSPSVSESGVTKQWFACWFYNVYIYIHLIKSLRCHVSYTASCVFCTSLCLWLLESRD